MDIPSQSIHQPPVNLEESKQSLSLLVDQISTELPRKVYSNLTESTYSLYLAFRNNKGVGPLREKVETNSINLSLSLFSKLTKQDLTLLQQKFESIIKDYYSLRKLEIPEAVIKYIQTDTPTSILLHEWQHAQVIPEQIRDKGSILITWLEDGSMSGVVDFDHSAVDNETLALSASEPESLSNRDIDTALSCARKTNKADFIAFIEDRVTKRLTHESHI